jgi:hypothetical protein
MTKRNMKKFYMFSSSWETGFVGETRNVAGKQVLVAHTYNPSYLGGRDWEDCSLKPVWANSL